MNIAIIGAGNVGRALGTSFTAAGHTVTYAARDTAGAREAADSIGARAAATPADAARDADVVVLAIPYETAGRDVAAQLAPVAWGRVVVHATNPLTADYGDLATRNGPSAAENFAAWMPGARLVKAFNTLFASVQANPATHGTIVDGLYATDDREAGTTVAALLQSVGFRPIYVGPLARARELEAVAFLNIQLQMQAQGDWRTAITFVGAPTGATQETAG